MSHHHVSDKELAEYSFGRLPAADAERVSAHLAVCTLCRRKLRAERAFQRAVRRALLAGPISAVHATKDGPIHLQVTRTARGTWLARHWGRELDGGWEFDTVEEANEWNLRSFAEMYPEHRCTGRCQSLKLKRRTSETHYPT